MAAVGIDLGTTNTVVAAVRDGRAVTIPDDDGRRLVPSVVSFHPNGSVIVGEGARERRLIDPANTIYSVKRLIGRSWQSDEVQQARGRFPFELREGAKNSTVVYARGESYALPEISAFVLRRAKAIAEKALGETVDRAVITVPANFNDLQRASTKVAGKLAGLEVLRILNEPTAAALAYGQGSTQSERLAVYDLGGGTFDITLLDLSGNVFEVLATAGDTALGGDDIDLAIADLMAEQIVRNHRFDPRVDVNEFARLRIYAEELKQRLSTEDEASIAIKDVGAGEGGRPITVQFKMSRDQLEREAQSMIERTLEVSRFAIETVSLKVEQLDRVILVGGPTRMPLVSREVERFFGKPPSLRVNPDEVVALGAAIQAHVLDRGKKRATVTVSPSMPVASMSAFAPRMEPTPPAVVLPRISLHSPPAQGSQAPPGGPAMAGKAMRIAPAQSKAPPHPADARDVLPPSDTAITAAKPAAALGKDAQRGPASPSFVPPSLSPPSLSLPRGAPSLLFEPAVPDLPVPPSPSPSPPTPSPPATPSGAPRVQPFAQFTPGAASTPPEPPPPAASLPAVPFVAESALAPRIAAPLLIDVTPLSLRIETVGGYCDVLIAANTAVPCDRTRVFLTAADGQTTVIIRVAQGESNRFAENTYLGELELSGLPPAARGDTQISVTFEIDADGILNVKAKDVKSGAETRARLQLLGANTDAGDVAQMMKRQEEHAVM